MQHILDNGVEKVFARLPSVPDFIVVGEMHGSKQNAPLVRDLLQVALAWPNPVTVAFEWALTDDEATALRAYVHGGPVPDPVPAFFLDSDGRFTYAHASLLQWIRAYNQAHDDRIDLHTFDRLDLGEDRDKAMADSLLAYWRQHPASILLVETGNRHARTAPEPAQGARQAPMCAILKEQSEVFSLFVRYTRGLILVEDTDRDVTQAASQQEGPGTYFDAEITIPASEASEKSPDLTTIASLLQ